MNTLNPDIPKLQSLRRIKITFALIYALFMSTRAFFGPFISIYLKEKGLSTDIIGVVTGMNSLAIIISQPFWGILSDKLRSIKKTLVFCIFMQAAFAILLLPASQVIMISVIFCLYTTFSSAEGPLLDIWSLSSIKDAGDSNAVGQLKLWGCMGYSLCSIFAGIYITRNSASGIIPVFTLVLLATALVLSLIRTNTTPQKAVPFRSLKVKRIFEDKYFLIFLAYIFFMQLGHRASYTFYPLLIQQLGGSSTVVGYSSALMFVSEALIMFLSKRMLTRFGAEQLVLASSVAFAIWHVFLRVASTPWQVMASCLMDGPSFALFTIGVLYYLDKLAPKELRTTYQTVAYSVYFGLSGITGNILGGLVIEHYSYQTMYSLSILITLLSSLVFIFIQRRMTQNANYNHTNS